MKARTDYLRLRTLIEPTVNALTSISAAVKETGFDRKIVELVKIRASQMNGCAFCLHMHVAEARAIGETDDRIHLLSAWRESPFFTPRERAALAWTEALTRIDQGHVPDEVFAEASAEFDEAELAQLTSMIIAINSWNRIAISYRFLHPVK